MSVAVIERVEVEVTPTGAERRDAPRVADPATIPSGSWMRMVDISVGGACLEGYTSLNRGDHFELILTDAEEFHTAMIEAEVMWKEELRIGLRWVNPSERDLEWLKARFGPGEA